MKPKLTLPQRERIVHRVINGEPIVHVASDAGISRGLLYRWLKRAKMSIKSNKNSQSKALKIRDAVMPLKGSIIKRPHYSVAVRIRAVEDYLHHKKTVSAICKELLISRTILFRWIKKYQTAGQLQLKQENSTNADLHINGEAAQNQFNETQALTALEDKKPVIESYPNQVIDQYVDLILNAVSEYPELSSHKLVEMLPRVGNRPVVGHHGVQNVLRRHDLTTYEKRLEYALSNKRKPFVFNQIMGWVLQILVGFFQMPLQARSRMVSFLSAFSIPVIVSVALLGTYNYLQIFIQAPSLVTSIGYVFASGAIVFGIFFLLYSAKYYISIALVLAYSRQSLAKQGKDIVLREGGTDHASGLVPDVSHISLERQPFVSIHLPMYNEKRVVNRLLEAVTSMNYENYEVIVCDDSTDETKEIVYEWKNHPRIKISHRDTRSGFKGAALQKALEVMNPKTEFVIVFDADFMPFPDTIEQFLRYFKSITGSIEQRSYAKSKVAALQGYQWHVLNKSENWLTRGVRTEYAGSYIIERSSNEIYGGLKQIAGSVYMIRADILKKFGWGNSITEDFELTLRLYAQGFQVVYTPYVQAPSECVSTIKRLIRQRMRWAEGHSFNVKKMFWPLLLSNSATVAEKFEFLYLVPYYLQSFFFLVGTGLWFTSEAIFQVRLPFWTEVWGWSLVLTNMFSLPLMNTVGMFLEEAEEKDYMGILSFLLLTYIVAPFQAYAAVKGFLEQEEGPWFRTPKTGRITDVFKRGNIYKWLFGFLSNRSQESAMQSQALTYSFNNRTSAHNSFNAFTIPSRNKLIGNFIILLVVGLTAFLYVQGGHVQSGDLAGLPIQTRVEKSHDGFGLIKSIQKAIVPQIAVSTGFTNQLTPSVSHELQVVSLVGLIILLIGFIALIITHPRSRKRAIRFAKTTLVFAMICAIVLGDLVNFIQPENVNQNLEKLSEVVAPKQTFATYQFSPTSQTIGAGTEITANSGAAVAAEGVNTGSWRGALASDNSHWQVQSTTSGIDVQLNFDGVQLNGANKMMIQTEFDTDATVPALKFQICDWSSSANVDTDEDANCNDGDDDNDGAGWRTFNSQDTSNNDVNFTAESSGDANVQWQIYDGYFTTGTTGGSAISTPLSNFVRSSDGRTKIRYFSSTNTTSTLSIDFLRIATFIDSIYHPADFHNDGSGTAAGTYANATVVTNTASAQGNVASGDGNHLTVGGTAGSVAAYHLDFNNVETYTGMNTIYVKAEYLCDTTNAALEHRPRIWNYSLNSGSGDWENLTDTDIDCSTTAAVRGWAVNNITITDYVQNGEIRIGWVGMDNGTHTIGLDYIYVIVGSTNTNDALCEVSFGTGTATNCVNTRDLDGTGTTATFDVTAENESSNMGTGEANSHYAQDNETTNDTTVENATSSNISFPVTLASNMAVTAVHFAGKFAAGLDGTNPDMTVQLGIRDYSGLNQSTGGWTQVGATSANNTQIYTDSISALSISVYGIMSNAEDYVDTFNNRMNIRLRTTAAGLSSRASVTQWDFAMVSLAWIEDSNHPTRRYQYNMTGQDLVNGTDQNVTSVVAATAEGVNKGSWKGMLADDNFHWQIASTTTGYDAQINFDGVELRGANKLMIQTELDLDATAPNTKLQICDWVSSANVDVAADLTYCTGGGWRTINTQDTSNNDVNYTEAATNGDALQWHIYDGYFTTGTAGGSPISTPLTNFINTSNNNRLKIRFYSETNTTSVVSLDFLRVTAIVDSVYHPADFHNDGSGTASGTYASAAIVGNTTTAQGNVTTGDGIHLSVAGTAGTVAAYHLDFNNVKTQSTMNTIYVKAEYLCDTTNAALEHRPRIWNYSLNSGNGDWELLTTSDIDCSTTAATNAWAKSNITISNYVQDGEIRIGWVGMDTGTHALQVDYVYVMVGWTNNNTSLCEITFGTGTATNCSGTTSLDVTGSTTDFTNGSEDESTNMGTGESNSFYVFDNESTPDATIEESTSSNIGIPVVLPDNTAVAALHYAGRFVGGSNVATDLTVQMGFKDYSGFNSLTGGWTQIGGTASYNRVYTDSITALTIGVYGLWTNPDDHLDLYNDRVNLKLRTTTAGTSSAGASTYWDFAFATVSWVETVETFEQSAYRFFANADSTDVGSVLADANTAATAASQGTNFRLRMMLHLSTGELGTSGQNFKLQIAQRGADNLCDTSFTQETYADLSPSTGAIRFGTNSPNDGVALTSNANDPTHGSPAHTVRNQTYEEDNIFTNSQSRIFSGEDAKYDFVLIDYSANADVTYCLRAVKSDGSALSTYTVIPEFTTVPEIGWLIAGCFPLLLGYIKKKRKQIKKV